MLFMYILVLFVSFNESFAYFPKRERERAKLPIENNST